MLIQRFVVRLHLNENVDPDGLFESKACLIFDIVAVNIYSVPNFLKACSVECCQ